MIKLSKGQSLPHSVCLMSSPPYLAILLPCMCATCEYELTWWGYSTNLLWHMKHAQLYSICMHNYLSPIENICLASQDGGKVTTATTQWHERTPSINSLGMLPWMHVTAVVTLPPSWEMLARTLYQWGEKRALAVMKQYLQQQGMCSSWLAEISVLMDVY